MLSDKVRYADLNTIFMYKGEKSIKLTGVNVNEQV